MLCVMLTLVWPSIGRKHSKNRTGRILTRPVSLMLTAITCTHHFCSWWYTNRTDSMPTTISVSLTPVVRHLWPLRVVLPVLRGSPYPAERSCLHIGLVLSSVEEAICVIIQRRYSCCHAYADVSPRHCVYRPMFWSGRVSSSLIGCASSLGAR